MREELSHPGPHIHEADLAEPAGVALEGRLRAYLGALALPEPLITAWVAQSCEGEANAAQAFTRLRALMADYWRQKGDGEPVDDVTAIARFRVCRWLGTGRAPAAPTCLSQLVRLMELPDIRRQSMVPESWGLESHE